MLDFHFWKNAAQKKWCAQIFSFRTGLTLCQQACQYAIIFFNSFHVSDNFRIFQWTSLIIEVSSASGSLVRITCGDFCFFVLLFLFVYLFSCLLLLFYRAFMKLRNVLPKQKCKSVDFSPTCWTSKQAFVEKLLRWVQSTTQNQTQTWDEKINNQNTSHQRCNLWRPSSIQSNNTGKPPQQRTTYVWEQERISRQPS